jgi:membrane protease YdiL (CAAX protease family)
MCLLGPLLEELLFRGYILKTWMQSKLGPLRAGVLVSLLWALIHLQYDAYDMFWVFLLGLLLSWSRLKTESIYPPLLLHVFWNSVASAQLLYYVG